jgi:hypothetical protein
MGVRVTPADALTDSDRLRALDDETVDAAPGSLVERLRRRAQDVQRQRTFELPVPGWGGELVLRFKPLEIAQLERFLARDASDVSANIEAMGVCCVAVLGRDGGRFVELADAEGPVRIEHRLGVLLGMPIPPDATLTTREVVLMLFGGNAMALGAFVDRLVTWMTDPSAREAPGES